MDDADVATLRDALADLLLERELIRTPAVEGAFRATSRHVFLPGSAPQDAYKDEAVPVKWSADGRPVSSSSQPAIMAIMLEQLGVAPGHRVLEIGTGTGYNAALLAHLAGPAGTVVSVEVDADLAASARERLRGAGCDRVSVIHGDGAAGWAGGAPYDRIITTASASDLAPAWLGQLAEGGRMVLPLSLRGLQQSVAFERAGDHLASTSVVPCGFMPLRGELAGPDPVRPLGEPGLFVRARGDLDVAALAAALRQPGETTATGVTITVPDLFGGLGLWLALHDGDAGELTAFDPAAGRGLIPGFSTHPGVSIAAGLVGTGAVAVLVHGGDGESREFEAAARGYGPGGGPLAHRLVAHVRDWQAAGRPAAQDLRVRAYPAGGGTGAPATAVVDAPHTRFLLDWCGVREGPA